ncbi:aminotransferase class I/II-fold pyridoxal phosphate-dependent enzyme [Papillibacter cinnamivorans]|nr:aminotransferase class I/II-fold pyridoxal phosphate-dependent enzyme [Papillibacter cinnamivorans]
MGKSANRQENMPLAEALERYRADRVVSFDVPGHKQGRGNPRLTEFLGKRCLSVDVNSMKPLDNLTHPISVIREAEELAADAFGSKYAFFMVNGTTSAVQAMILYACRRGDKIILPRNVHTSAINALILCGAVPVYVDPGVDRSLGIALGMTPEAVERAIRENPDARAVLVNNPTYYGICPDTVSIAKLARANGLLVLADEAHGTHFSFGEGLPVPAMRAGADMAAVSMHKTGGSLTQSSILLAGERVDPGYLRQIINLTGTTSASYLLMSSLDIARRNLAVEGKETFSKVLALAEYARGEINRLGGYRAFGPDIAGSPGVFGFDRTRLPVFTREIGLAGIEVYDMLRDDYGIQVEFGDLGNILAILSVGDSELMAERLVSALQEIRRLKRRDPSGMFDHEYIPPQVVLPPQEAFYAKRRSLPLADSAGRVCGESVMSYPPGIPVVAPGERITGEIVEYIRYARDRGCRITGTVDPAAESIQVLEE